MPVIDNLVFSLSMDDASGNATDDHSTNDFTETGGAIASAAGMVSTSREFVNTDGRRFSLADNAEISTGDIDWSFELWVYFADNTQRKTLVGKDDVGGRDYAFYYQASGTPSLELWIDGTTAGTVVKTFTPTVNIWYHVACGHSAASNELWISVNADTPTTAATSGPAIDSSSPLQVGAKAYSGFEEFHNGRLDEVRMYKRDIRSDLSWMYNSGSGRSYADLVAEAGGGGGGLLLMQRTVLDYD